MEKKGKFPCRSAVCSVFAGDHGRARRRSWTSSLGCLASTHSMALWTRRKRRRQLTTTLCTTPGRPRARIRTKVLLRHILEAPLHGRVGIDLHLGKKPKLGGRYADDSLIYIYHNLLVLCISMFRFLFFVVLILISAFQNTKSPKIFPLFLFVCLFSSLVLVCFISYFRFDIWKIQKYFALFAVSFCSYFKIRKPKNILLFFFGFVKFVAEFSLPWLDWRLVITSYYSNHTSERQ
jgi:hypothetical protein